MNWQLLISFPNLFIALKIFLTLTIAVVSVERSFSKLKIIENYPRSSMSQESLSDLLVGYFNQRN
nr:unnamed protein product [Callosobruchus chinensis]